VSIKAKEQATGAVPVLTTKNKKYARK